jgi:hypothetical protein
MKKQATIFLCILFAIVTVVCVGAYADTVFAQGTMLQNANDQTAALLKETELGREESPQIIIAGVINVALGMLGIGFVALSVYAGMLYVTSRGDEGQVTKAKKTLIAATAGLTLVMLSYSIASFVGDRAQRIGAGDPTLLYEE